MSTKEIQFKNSFQEKATKLNNVKELIQHSKSVGNVDEDKLHVLKELLNSAVILEFATIPIYLQAMWTIKDNKCEVAKSIRNIFQEEMLHMAMVCNMIVGIGGEPRIYNTKNRLKYPSGLPGGVHPDLFLYLEGLNDCSLRNFMEIELPEEIAKIYDYETKEPVTIGRLCNKEGVISDTKHHQSYEHNTTIGALYDRINELFQELQPKMNVERQLAGPLSWWVMADAQSVSKAIDMIKEQGEGSENVTPASTGIDNLAHFYRFWEVYYKKKIVQEGDKYYFKDPMPRPELYHVARIPEGGYKKEDVSPEVWHLVNSFDEVYTDLLKFLEDAWAINGRGQAALVNAIEVMFKLEQFALPLMQIPIPDKEGLHYGPCFRIL
ncbi:ferritin-like protein [Flavivirga sp. 57AJ16]|uniref:ferritin-like domain-containing protein n=1 Tax=Flavivirga sp. 57AJ16 TaxID=3025307 RepID=UPI002366849B|nr:ferritin-like protein [Flavivirga sp. 57AJ16]MDD7885653.1 ferritin-like protein [Flavivirga sp. 57AJ16]